MTLILGPWIVGNGSMDHDNEEIETLLEEMDEELQHDILGSEEEQMESTNG